MKIALCFIIPAALAIAMVASEAGRSACLDSSEVDQTFPHHFDPTKYWHCETFGQPAVEHQCEHEHAYMHFLKRCIPWQYWQWKEPQNPPTLA